MGKDIGLAPPAILALYRYAADAPAIVCEEGYWDDQASANADDMRQEKSCAADLVRTALAALGYPAPEGRPVCAECYCYLADGHSGQCSLGRDE